MEIKMVEGKVVVAVLCGDIITPKQGRSWGRAGGAMAPLGFLTFLLFGYLYTNKIRNYM
jgi:hypothetical protein